MLSRTGALAAGLAAAVVLAACGSDRPTESDLADAIYENGNGEHRGELWIGLVNNDVDRAGAQCMAEALLASDIEEGALRALVDQDPDFEWDEQMLSDLRPVYEPLGACMGVTGDPDQFLTE